MVFDNGEHFNPARSEAIVAVVERVVPVSLDTQTLIAGLPGLA
jgi:hypothetical protein